jgi:hypothetical protein
MRSLRLSGFDGKSLTRAFPMAIDRPRTLKRHTVYGYFETGQSSVTKHQRVAKESAFRYLKFAG